MIRVFGSKRCPKCKELVELLKLSGYDFEYIDAHSKKEGIQDFCDEQNINHLPHLQIVTKDNKVISNFIKLNAFSILDIPKTSKIYKYIEEK